MNIFQNIYRQIRRRLAARLQLAPARLQLAPARLQLISVHICAHWTAIRCPMDILQLFNSFIKQLWDIHRTSNSRPMRTDMN